MKCKDCEDFLDDPCNECGYCNLLSIECLCVVKADNECRIPTSEFEAVRARYEKILAKMSMKYEDELR